MPEDEEVCVVHGIEITLANRYSVAVAAQAPSPIQIPRYYPSINLELINGVGHNRLSSTFVLTLSPIFHFVIKSVNDIADPGFSSSMSAASSPSFS